MDKKTIYMYVTEDSFKTIMDAVREVIETDSYMDPDTMNDLIDAYNEFMSWYDE